MLAIASDQRMRQRDHEQRRVDAIAQHLPNLASERVSAGWCSEGERLYDWAPIRGWEEDGWSHGLARRSIEAQPSMLTIGFMRVRARSTLEALVPVAGQR